MAYVWAISLIAAMGGLLFGYDWVVIGGAKPFFERFFGLTSTTQKGWANSCALIGCLIGALMAGTFWTYAAICIAGFVFVLLRVPETKGKSLEQIERELVD